MKNSSQNYDMHSFAIVTRKREYEEKLTRGFNFHLIFLCIGLQFCNNAILNQWNSNYL